MNLVWIILSAILLAAFFSAIETAYLSANKLQVELEKKAHTLKSGLFRLLTKNQVQFRATLLFGYILALVLFGISATYLFNLLPGPGQSNQDFLSLTILVIVASTVFLILAEYPAKVLSRLYPNVFLSFLQIPVALFYFILYPFIRLLVGLSRLGQNLVLKNRVSHAPEFAVFNKIDLNDFFREQEKGAPESDESPEKEVILFRNALDFSKVKLREIMVPRTEIEAMDLKSDLSEIKQRFIDTGYSRLLLYDGNIDNVMGYIHSYSLFTSDTSLQTHINKLLIVPESMPASKLLRMFIQEHRSMAIVVDEFGGTSGLVTTEDILEEIFGEIEDEHDNVNYIEKRISENEYILSGRIEIDTLNEKYNIDLPVSENYETLAGLILFNYESIPKINTVVEIGYFSFKILKATNTKVELVKLTTAV